MRVTVELRKTPGRTKTLFSHELTRITRIRAGGAISNQPVSALSKAISICPSFFNSVSKQASPKRLSTLAEAGQL